MDKFHLFIFFYKNLKKYNIHNRKYERMKINNLLISKNSHFVSLFKDYLIFDFIDEFLRRFYSIKEILLRLPKFPNYYKNYLKFFCIPIFSDFYANKILSSYGEIKAEIYYNSTYGNSNKKVNKENFKTIFTETVKKNIENNKKQNNLFFDDFFYISTINANKSINNNNNNNKYINISSKNKEFNYEEDKDESSSNDIDDIKELEKIISKSSINIHANNKRKFYNLKNDYTSNNLYNNNNYINVINNSDNEIKNEEKNNNFILLKSLYKVKNYNIDNKYEPFFEQSKTTRNSFFNRDKNIYKYSNIESRNNNSNKNINFFNQTNNSKVNYNKKTKIKELEELIPFNNKRRVKLKKLSDLLINDSSNKN